ncbi:hypothetical protein [Companilactobacillus mishanensis]|uniref:hypothetical protein n=1 Tax=Companilactobacillus mishanensis TaxID=2486008 RepID=UPI0013DDEF0C|nr:hypothetical protein [Companilactobacillus mishanensis]
MKDEDKIEDITHFYTQSQIDELIDNLPVETIETDSHGNYDPKEHPEFHDWNVNG